MVASSSATLTTSVRKGESKREWKYEIMIKVKKKKNKWCQWCRLPRRSRLCTETEGERKKKKEWKYQMMLMMMMMESILL
jgi:hypothetical protein